MNNNQKRELCLALMRADSETEVIRILTEAGYENDKRVWRLYGDRENNFSTIGNQQNRPDAALVEKLINSVDARLMHECLSRGINPESPAAPQSIRDAVAKFFEEGRKHGSVYDGQIKAWDNEMRREIARGITLAATGAKPKDEGDLCLTIADQGEGQTPRKFPETFLSLEKSNKLRIPFVQGKFNMGGTGVLEFCGRHNFQLLLSRRSPRILNGNFNHPTDNEWGFTLVRREDPSGNRRSSSYTFLAPVGVDEKPQQGEVLTFAVDKMPIFPELAEPYARDAEWGTLIKLYEYSLPGHRTHILLGSGLLSRLELLLPELALPIRLHECRLGYKGHKGSMDTTLTGLGVRSNVNLQNGIASLSIKFPEHCKVGEKLEFVAVVNDSTRIEPFENKFSILFQKAAEPSGGNGHRQKPPKDESGDEREMPGGIEIPKPIQVRQEDWEKMAFDQFTALEIKDSGERGASAAGRQDIVVYDFLINVDNVHLKRFLKTELNHGEDDKVAKTRFELGMMLVTLALIHQDRMNQTPSSAQNEGAEMVIQSLEGRVANVTKALAPFLLPMIGALGALDEEKVAAGSASGEAM